MFKYKAWLLEELRRILVRSVKVCKLLKGYSESEIEREIEREKDRRRKSEQERERIHTLSSVLKLEMPSNAAALVCLWESEFVPLKRSKLDPENSERRVVSSST